MVARPPTTQAVPQRPQGSLCHPPLLPWNPHASPGGFPHAPHLLAPGSGHPRLLLPGPRSRDLALVPGLGTRWCSPS